jgi:hypothetical protein
MVGEIINACKDLCARALDCSSEKVSYESVMSLVSSYWGMTNRIRILASDLQTGGGREFDVEGMKAREFLEMSVGECGGTTGCLDRILKEFRDFETTKSEIRVFATLFLERIPGEIWRSTTQLLHALERVLPKAKFGDGANALRQSMY